MKQNNFNKGWCLEIFFYYVYFFILGVVVDNG